jgi:hypothetical protein
VAVDDRTGGLTMHLPQENNTRFITKHRKILAKTWQLLRIKNPKSKLGAKYRKY